MIKDLINSFLNPSYDNEYVTKINDLIFPIKCYLCLIILFLIIILVSNIFLYFKLYN